MGALSGDARRRSPAIVGTHERAHVAALKKALGSAAVAKPSFDFKGTTEDEAKFRATAQVLEDTGVMAVCRPGAADRVERGASAPRSRSTPSRRATPRGSGT